MEALADVLVEVNRKGFPSAARISMYRARTTPLLSVAAQDIEVAQMADHLFHGDLVTQKSKVDLRANLGRFGRCDGLT